MKVKSPGPGLCRGAGQQFGPAPATLDVMGIEGFDRQGRIEVITRFQAGAVEIVFRDDGVGIPPHASQRIFDPFFSTKPTGEGTGLGLSVSYGIVKDHGGEIRMTSKPGHWTEFVVVLPETAGEDAGSGNHRAGGGRP